MINIFFSLSRHKITSKFHKTLLILFIMLLLMTASLYALERITKISLLPSAQWQKTADFPDWLGRVDDTLALNSMISFHFWHSQGEIYLRVSEQVRNFDMFINNTRINTSSINTAGVYMIDISDYTVDGINTVQISNIEIEAGNNKKTVSLFIPYPVILESTPKDSGIRPEALSMISDIIESDVINGFPSAQLAVIRNGKLVYSNAWGKGVNTNTLYDLASVTKVFSVNYAIQKLVTDGKLDIDTKITDILGAGFAQDTININYKGTKMPDIKTMRNWKASLTVRDVMCHRAGFPSEFHYHDKNYSPSQLKHDSNAKNILYTGIDGSPETRSKTLHAIFKTPLCYQPRTKILYSDVDYMLLCFIVEKITGQRLDIYMRENFWKPLNLKRTALIP